MDKEVILKQYKERKNENEILCQTLDGLLKRLLSLNGISVNAVNSRVKEQSSLDKKIIKKKNKYNCIDDITDIVGSRIITYYSDDVDKISKIIEEEFVIDKENSIDKRKSLEPEKFGYMSLHYVCQFSPCRTDLGEYSQFKERKFEIQISSILQHTWAEIEHDTGYKTQVAVPKEIRRYFSRLAGLLELADDEIIRIREKLNEYEQDVEILLEENRNDEVLIDKISLRKFLDLNNEIKQLDFRIKKLIGCELKDSSTIEDSINRLDSLNINTIGQINNMVKNNIEVAYKIAKIFLSDASFDGEIQHGIGLFYLCYAELFIREASDEEIRNYFENNNIGDEDDGPSDLREAFEKIKEDQVG